ncbi:hypothetical protein [Flindersiella endophytica]
MAVGLLCGLGDAVLPGTYRRHLAALVIVLGADQFRPGLAWQGIEGRLGEPGDAQVAVDVPDRVRVANAHLELDVGEPLGPFELR